MKAVFDTNILVDFLTGVPEAAEELGRYSDRLISQITWMEVMAGCRDDPERQTTRAFLDTFQTIAIGTDVAESAVMLRQTHRLRLPDAIILATAERTGALLVTRDAKDFSANHPGIRIPYKL